MFDNCTVKYHKNIHSGKVDSILVFYPKIINDDGTYSQRQLGVPMNEENTDYLDILEWVAEGNTIEEAD